MKNKDLGRLAGLALLLACGLMLVRPAPVQAALNSYLKLSGIKGEATDQDHKDWIIIESFSMGIGKTMAAAGPGEITITKTVDKASPSLAECVAKGTNFREATIEFKRTDGKPGYVSYLLKNVRIVSRILGPGGRTETMKLAYQSAQASGI